MVRLSVQLILIRYKQKESYYEKTTISFNCNYVYGYSDVYVTSPDSPKPTENMKDHLVVVKGFIDAFPDHKIQLPYKAVFGSGDWICAVHENGGTFTEPWHLPNGQTIKPTGKKFTMTMVTVGKAKDGSLKEEMIIYDMSTMMRQLGLMNQ